MEAAYSLSTASDKLRVHAIKCQLSKFSDTAYLGTGGFKTSGGAILTVTGLCIIFVLRSLRIGRSTLWKLTGGITPSPLYCGWCVGYRRCADAIGLSSYAAFEPEGKLQHQEAINPLFDFEVFCDITFSTLDI